RGHGPDPRLTDHAARDPSASAGDPGPERMKPAPFAYVRPDSLAGAVAALHADGDARPIAGGQSLIPLLAMRRLRPSTLIDITRIPDLDRLAVSDGELV